MPRLLTAAVLLAFAAAVPAQEPFTLTPPPADNSRSLSKEMYEGKRQVLKGTGEAANITALGVWAKNLVYPVTNNKYYYPKDITDKGSDLIPISDKDTVQQLMKDLDEFILKPSANTKYNFDQADYIVKFGEALNVALKAVLEAKDMPQHVRLNAARMLAIAARSGAPAHADMIIGLLTKTKDGTKGELEFNDATPLEVLPYAIQAAGNLLAAHDSNLLRTGSASNHTIDNNKLVKLIRGLELIVQKTTPYNKNVSLAAAPEAELKTPAAKDPKEPKKKDEVKTADKTVTTANPEWAVIRFYRRLAIRALSEVRFPVIINSENTLTVRPLHTLAKVAVNDGDFRPPLGGEEYADALRGLCNLHTLQGVDLEALLTCIAVGTKNFANVKSDPGGETALPWKAVGTRLNITLSDWLKMAETNGNMSGSKEKIDAILSLILKNVTRPLEETGKSAKMELNEIQGWLKNRKVTEIVLFNTLPEAQKKAYQLNPKTN